MAYTSIEEAWGGIDGSGMLNIPVGDGPNNQPQLQKRMHPAHKRALERQLVPAAKGKYRCPYRDGTCQDAVQLNADYNEQQKMIVRGYPPKGGSVFQGNYPPKGGSVFQGNYPPKGGYQQMDPYPYGYPAIAPQYPWYGPVRQEYLNYPQQVSQQFYQNPWTHPQVAQGIQQYQQQHPKHKRVEHFGGASSRGAVNMHKITIIFLIFLFAMALVLCVVLIFLACSIKN